MAGLFAVCPYEIEQRIGLPEEVQDLRALASYLHQEAAWIAVGVTYNNDEGRLAAPLAGLQLGEAWAYEEVARLTDELLHLGPPDPDEEAWQRFDRHAERARVDAEQRDGFSITLIKRSGEPMVRVQTRMSGGRLDAERQVADLWQAHTVVGALLSTLAAQPH